MTLPGLPNPWLILAVVLAFGAATGAAYYKGGVDKENSMLAQQKRDDDIETHTFNAAMTGAAAVIAKNRANNTIIKQTLEKTIEHDYDPNCRSSDDGMRAVNDALANRKSQPADPSGVPRAVAPAH